MKVAIIDLGTNTFHLLLAEVNGRHHHIILDERVPVRIGVGGINQNLIVPEAMNRAIDAIGYFKTKIEELGASRIYAFGTSALRNAKNNREVILKIKAATGVEVKIISGDEEAHLIYEGVNLALQLREEKNLIVDIGGGSVECIIANGKEIFWKRSFEIGAQRLLELYQKHDPIAPDEVTALMKFYNDALAPLIQAVEIHSPKILAGSSGTFETLSDIYCLQSGMELKRTPEVPFIKESFEKIYTKIIERDRAARMEIPGMIELRVDMIVVASCLVKFLIDKFHPAKIRVSSYSLKEGALALLMKDGMKNTEF